MVGFMQERGELSSPEQIQPASYNILISHTDALGKVTFAMILNDLSPVAYKWKDIAIQLGSTFDEVKNIEVNLLIAVQGPQACLREVIGIWLKGDPTIPALIEALKSESVGEAMLSETLEKKYHAIL
jgi:hypothetical protein